MKEWLTVRIGEVEPPKHGKEFATFCWMLALPMGREILDRFGLKLGEVVEVVVHSNPDDPPDLSAFGVGFEVTEFPPNQSILDNIHIADGGRAMSLPPLHRTGKNYRDIKREVEDPTSASNSAISGGLYEVEAEIAALAEEFRRLLRGPDAKDVPGNTVLLLDQRGEVVDDLVVGPAVKRTIAAAPPKHIRLVVLVRNKDCVQVYP